MNPYEAPQAADQRPEDSRRRRKLVAVILVLGVVLIVGGAVTLSRLSVQRATELRYKATLRAKRAEAEAVQAMEAAKAASQGSPSTHDAK